MPRKVDEATLWEMTGQGRYLFWSMIYTNVEERKVADEYLRFELEGRSILENYALFNTDSHKIKMVYAP